LGETITALLALSAAVAYGAGDFLGGLAARREPASAVVLWSHIVGFFLLLAAAPLVGGSATTTDLAIGAAAGLAGGLGVAGFYKALSLGRMSVVAPITGLLSAAVPVVAGFGRGERPQPAALAGIALALVAITLVSREGTSDDEVAGQASGRSFEALGLAIGAGLAFGLFFVIISGTGDDAGIWPLVASRVASVSLFAVLAGVGLGAGRPPRSAVGAAVGCGVLDAGANVFFVLALSHGLLSIVSVLSALYPAGTVLLARYLLGERMTALQQTGLVFAGAAAVLIAA
jgi:drug/metabolite transporter (DMT)-like permease